MKKVLIPFVALALLAGPGAAHAQTQVKQVAYDQSAESEALYQSWIAASWVPTPAVELTVYPRTCQRPGTPYACAWPARSKCAGYENDPPECWYGYVIDLPTVNRRLFAHEMGHVFDFAALSSAERSYFSRLLRLPAWDPWTGSAGASAERFADLYSGCMLGGRKKAWYEATRKMWTRKVFRRGCRLIRQAA